MDTPTPAHSPKQLELAKSLAALLAATLAYSPLTSSFTPKPNPLAYGARVQVGSDGKLGPYRSTIELDLRGDSHLSLAFVVSGHVALTCPIPLTPALAQSIQLTDWTSPTSITTPKPLLRILAAALPRCLEVIRTTHPYSLKAQ